MEEWKAARHFELNKQHHVVGMLFFNKSDLKLQYVIFIKKYFFAYLFKLSLCSDSVIQDR